MTMHVHPVCERLTTLANGVFVSGVKISGSEECQLGERVAESAVGGDLTACRSLACQDFPDYTRLLHP